MLHVKYWDKMKLITKKKITILKNMALHMKNQDKSEIITKFRIKHTMCEILG